MNDPQEIINEQINNRFVNQKFLNEGMLSAKGWVVKMDSPGAPYTFLTTQSFKNEKERDVWIKSKLAKQKETGKIASVKPL